jgi:hypothetical protein
MTMNALKTAPQIVVDLAASVGLTEALKWREEDTHFIIIANDGRKFTFQKLDARQARENMSTADFKEHVGEEAKNKSRKKEKE